MLSHSLAGHCLLLTNSHSRVCRCDWVGDSRMGKCVIVFSLLHSSQQQVLASKTDVLLDCCHLMLLVPVFPTLASYIQLNLSTIKFVVSAAPSSLLYDQVSANNCSSSLSQRQVHFVDHQVDHHNLQSSGILLVPGILLILAPVQLHQLGTVQTRQSARDTIRQRLQGLCQILI